MRETRRTRLKRNSTTLLGVGPAGCSGIFEDGNGESISIADQDSQSTDDTTDDGDSSNTAQVGPVSRYCWRAYSYSPECCS